jgi:FMN phosphatase YigB (HAD superfamily)
LNRDATPTPGTRVKLVRFSTDNTVYDDNEHVPSGTLGTVNDIDDAGTIHVRWDNGCHLGLIKADLWEYA